MPSALLVHGITSSGTTWWRAAADLADLGWSVRTPTLPGHGGTPPPEGEDPLQGMADAIAALLRQRPVDLLLGHSLGALVVLTVAAQHPDLARAVVVEDPPGRNGRPMGELVGDLAEDTERARLHPEAEVAARLERNPRWSLVDARESVANQAGLDVAAAERLIATAGWDLPALVAACPLPLSLLVAEGPGSALAGPDRAAVLAAVGPARTSAIESGHSIHRDRPALWLQAVLRAAP